MDLIKELEKMEKSNLYPREILKEINEEKSQLEKKEYIFQALAIARDVEDYILLKNFGLCNIGGFELTCCEHNDETHSISLNFYRPDGEIISHNTMTKDYPEILQRFREIFNGDSFKSLKDLTVKSKYLNKDFIESGWGEIGLVDGAGEEILNLLLNKELKTILDYSKMQLDLDDKKELGKKLKL